MEHPKISSLQNPLVKEVVLLRENRAFREEKKLVFVEGEKMLLELLPHIRLSCFFATEERPYFKGYPTYIVSEAVFEKITKKAKSKGVAALLEMPEERSLVGKNRILAIDDISDPGNLGTLLRTALAFSWDGIFQLPHSVDLFNDKVLRSSKGGSFLLPFMKGTFEDLLELKRKNNATLYIGDLKGKNVEEETAAKSFILLLSNEARGAKEEALKEGVALTIPISSKMESLNVAIAGSILMYHLQRQQ